jgi:hypothetical protein
LGLTVKDLLRRIDSRELSEWMAFYNLEPWGCEAENRRFGTIAATFANVHRKPKKKPTPYSWLDFFPSGQKLKQTAQEMMQILKRAWGGGKSDGNHAGKS